jgi:sphingolipid 8-(E)-desaturase
MLFDGASKFFISMQHRLYYVVMSLARFNLYANSYVFLWKRATHPKKGWLWWLEVAGLMTFIAWLGRVLVGVYQRTGSWKTALGYLLVSHMVASPLHVQVSTCSSRLDEHVSHLCNADRLVSFRSVDR